MAHVAGLAHATFSLDLSVFGSCHQQTGQKLSKSLANMEKSKDVLEKSLDIYTKSDLVIQSRGSSIKVTCVNAKVRDCRKKGQKLRRAFVILEKSLGPSSSFGEELGTGRHIIFENLCLWRRAWTLSDEVDVLGPDEW